MINNKETSVLKMVQLAMLTAIVIVLQCLSIPLGATAINLALLPVVIGASICGIWAGAWLGLVSGVTILVSQQAAFFFTMSPFATIVVVLLKGCASGAAAGFVYSLLEKKNKYIAVVIAGLTAPVVNTAIFLIGCLTLFYADFAVYGNVFVYVVTTFIAINFPIEIGMNMLFSPVIVRIIDIVKKKL